MGAAGADKVNASVVCVERDTVIDHQTDIALYHALDFKDTPVVTLSPKYYAIATRMILLKTIC